MTKLSRHSFVLMIALQFVCGCLAAVSSTVDGRRTICMTAVVRVADGRHTIRKQTQQERPASVTV